MKKVLYLAIGLLLPAASVYAQQQHPVMVFSKAGFSTADSLRLLRDFGNNKTLPRGFELQTLVALSYFPELKNSRIEFKVKPAYSLLQTRPVPHGIFSRGTRHYTITISDSSYWKLQPIRLDPMNFNAQVGVLGHELSHVVDFSRRSLLSLVASGIGHLSSRYIDRFEYNTDSICIAHGLGYQLLAWSVFVRSMLHTDNYDGADNIDKPMMHERYMNPPTIRARIAQNTMYSTLQ